VWGSGGKPHAFLTSALDRGEWSDSRPKRSIYDYCRVEELE